MKENMKALDGLLNKLLSLSLFFNFNSKNPLDKTAPPEKKYKNFHHPEKSLNFPHHFIKKLKNFLKKKHFFFPGKKFHKFPKHNVISERGFCFWPVKVLLQIPPGGTSAFQQKIKIIFSPPLPLFWKKCPGKNPGIFLKVWKNIMTRSYLYPRNTHYIVSQKIHVKKKVFPSTPTSSIKNAPPFSPNRGEVIFLCFYYCFI